MVDMDDPAAPLCYVGRYLLRSALDDWQTPCPQQAVYCIPMETVILLCAEHTNQLYEVLDEAGLSDHDIVYGPGLDTV